MTNELPERLRAIAETVTEWDNPLCAKEDLLKAAERMEEQQAEIERLKQWCAYRNDKIVRMEKAISLTISENLHLADGDSCTLWRLKEVIADREHKDA